MQGFGFRPFSPPGLYAEPMPILESLASMFINTFGITQPSEETRRRAAWFILGLLVIALSVVAMIGVVLYHVLRR
jgi:hypothetical protein